MTYSQSSSKQSASSSKGSSSKGGSKNKSSKSGHKLTQEDKRKGGASSNSGSR